MEMVSKATHGRMSVVALATTPKEDALLHKWEPVLVLPTSTLQAAATVENHPLVLPLTSSDWEILGAKGIQPSVFWLSTTHTLLAPYLVSSSGQLLNTTVLGRAGVMPSPEKVLKKAATSKGAFMFGTKGPILTTFMDPDCIWCHRLFMESKSDVDAGKFRLRVVLVGVLGQNSVARAVSILASPSPAKAFMDDETGFNVATEQGAAPLATSGSKAWTKWQPQVKANSELMSAAGSRGTPTLLFCDQASKQVKLQSGYTDPATILASLGTQGSSFCTQ